MPILGTPQESIDLAEDRGASARCSTSSASSARETASPAAATRPLAIAARIGYPVLVRPSYVLGGRAMEIVYDDDAPRAVHRHGRERQPRAPGPDRQVPRGRDRGRRRRAVRRRRRCTSAASCSTSRRPASTPATRPACIPSLSLGEGTLEEVRRQTRAAGAGAGRQGAHERAVRLPERRALRARGEPARLAHGAVRQQGDRGAAGQAGDAHHPGSDAQGARSAASPRAAPRQRQGGGACRSTASPAPTTGSGPR